MITKKVSFFFFVIVKKPININNVYNRIALAEEQNMFWN